MHTVLDFLGLVALSGLAFAGALLFQIYLPEAIKLYRLRADIRNSVHEVIWALLALTFVFFSVTGALWLSNCTDADLQQEGAAYVAHHADN